MHISCERGKLEFQSNPTKKENGLRFISTLLISLTLLVACGEARPHLEEIRERGELRVLTRYAPTTYYIQGDQLAGIEYEMAKRFAEYLNVTLKIIVPENLGSMLEQIAEGKADLAAAGLTVTPERKLEIEFGPTYQQVTQQLVYRQGNDKLKNISQLKSGQLEVVADSSHVERLKELQEDFPDLNWTANEELDSSGLLELVDRQLIDYTVADSNEVAANQVLFPELRVAFDLTDPQDLAWAIPRSSDRSLHAELVSFFNQLEASGELDQLMEEHYGHIRRFDYLDAKKLHRRIQTHLPLYQTAFKSAAEEFGFDWKLLAAIAYQESHWDKDAVSPTGVRGLMMLTTNTAKLMKISDRKDPLQSIQGGAGYLASIRARLNEDILEPDRTWFALAAYNVGLGHVLDARKLTVRGGKNPDKWSDVREFLPRLSKRKWFETVKHGYARGGEPVRYVRNIRRYYDILLRQDVVPLDEPDTLPEVLTPSAL